MKRGCDVVVVAGGDGTIDYVFTHLADRSIPIGILPLGSADNIARSLGIAGTPAELAEQWRIGHVHSFHLVEVTYGKDKRKWCTEGFGLGLLANLSNGVRSERMLVVSDEAIDSVVHVCGQLASAFFAPGHREVSGRAPRGEALERDAGGLSESGARSAAFWGTPDVLPT